MRIQTSSAQNEIILIEVVGEIDAHTASQLDRTLDDLLAQGHYRLVLDASQMGFISSSGLRTIVFANLEAAKHGGQLRVCGLSAQARRIIEMAGLDESLDLVETRREAVESW